MFSLSPFLSPTLSLPLPFSTSPLRPALSFPSSPPLARLINVAASTDQGLTRTTTGVQSSWLSSSHLYRSDCRGWGCLCGLSVRLSDWWAVYDWLCVACWVSVRVVRVCVWLVGCYCLWWLAVRLPGWWVSLDCCIWLWVVYWVAVAVCVCGLESVCLVVFGCVCDSLGFSFWLICLSSWLCVWLVVRDCGWRGCT